MTSTQIMRQGKMSNTAKPSMNVHLKSFWLTPSRFKILSGGRDSGKSWDAAANAIRMADYCKMKFLCTRQFQNRIEDSVYSLLKIQIERFGLKSRFTVTNNKIIHNITGSEFLFYGIQRNLEEMKSIESVDVLWIEEAATVTKEQMDILEPTIRKDGSEIWCVYNPNLITDYIHDRFVVQDEPYCVHQHINYDQNPFLSNTSKRRIEHLAKTDPDSHAYIYLGIPKGNDDSSVIKLKWIQAAIDAHLKIDGMFSGSHTLGYDIADDGGDTNATILAKGSVAIECDEWKGLEDELLKSCRRAYSNALRVNAHINYDSIGVGATAGAKFEEINEARSLDNGYVPVEYSKFNAGSRDLIDPDGFYSEHDKITNKDKFANIKAQSWWLLADRFRNTYDYLVNGNTDYTTDQLISLSSEMDHVDRLTKELSTPLRDVDNNGRDKVESKKDLKKRGVASPNLADALVMAFVKPESNGWDDWL